MKKCIFILLLVVSFCYLAAVESAPSAVVGYVKYPCTVGLNYVALPMDAGYSFVSDVVAPYNITQDNIDVVNIWNSVGQYWESCVNYGGGYWEPDEPVGNGSVLFFNTITVFDFYSIGRLFSTHPVYSIRPGLNSIMIPLNRSDLLYVSDFGIEIGDNVDVVNLWRNVGQFWDACVNYGGGYYDPDYNIGIAFPLFINSASTMTWPSTRMNIQTESHSKY